MFIGGAEIFTAVIENALDKMTNIRVFKHSPGFKALFFHSLTTKTAHVRTFSITLEFAKNSIGMFPPRPFKNAVA